MSSRHDATGLLLFESRARITQVIQLLFAPFNLLPLEEVVKELCYIEVPDSGPVQRWDRYVDHLIRLSPEPLCAELLRLQTPADVLLSIGHRLNVDLKAFVGKLDFASPVQITDVVRLAQQLPDGHNLIGVSVGGAEYADSAYMDVFRDWATLASRRYRLHAVASDMSALARTVDLALPAVPDAAVEVLDGWLTRFIDGIADASLKQTLRARYGLKDAPAHSTTTSDNTWSRSVYVGAQATDEGGGPEWARIDVTPDFIRRLESLRAACHRYALNETSIVDAPAFWGPGVSWNHMPLFKPRLVVTADSFWFTVNPSRRVCAFETLPLSLNWLITTVAEGGEPLYRRIDPAQVQY
jgi:hypothetical protein